jgi:hypothetical protein
MIEPSIEIMHDGLYEWKKEELRQLRKELQQARKKKKKKKDE